MKPDPFIAKALDPRSFTRQAQDEFDAWLRTQGMTWRGVESGAYGISLNDALVMWTISDPVRWAETFLVEPNTGEPYKLFDYQRESLRAWDQDVVHQDGAEVGKTREITVLILWGCCTSMGGTIANPSMLVTAPMQSHLDEIIMAVEAQVGAQESGEAKGSLLSPFWRKPKRTPHTLHKFSAPNFLNPSRPSQARVYYRPLGHDGEALRGVHVTALGLMDEAAKAKRELHFSEFYRALEPGAKSRMYSVPDGDNSTPYFRLTQRAVLNLPRGTPGVRKFHWPKTLMPAPFWSPERDAEFIRRYGGRHTPGYIRNVLGEHGQAENPVWSWDLLTPNIDDLPDFRILKLRADRGRDELSVELLRIRLDVMAGKKVPTEDVLESSALSLHEFIAADDETRRTCWRRLLRRLLLGDGMGVYFAGCDLGESNDPTEIILSERRGTKLVDVLRVNATGLPYHAQRELIFGISELWGHLPHWGADLGSAGTAVVKDLQNSDAYAEAHFDERMTGFNFSEAVDCVGEDGEPLRDLRDDSVDKVVRAPAKDWATKCITARLQQCGYAMAYDNEALNWMTNHTSKEGAKHTIYAKDNDHNIDARRQQMLRMLFDDQGADLDHFSTGVHDRRAA